MVSYRIAIAHLMCLSVWAASDYTVERIKSFAHSAVQLKSPDPLSESLEMATVAALQGDGAAALFQARPPAPKAGDVSPQSPSSEEQAKLLDEVRQYAINYTQRLPDFICLEQTRRYADPNGREAWRLLDTLTARLSYFNQKEDYKLVSQNGRLVSAASYATVGGTYSMGDFGTTMRDIFDPASHTSFAWERSTTLRGRRTHVFSYRVPLRLYNIDYQGERKDDVQRTKVAYRGSVFVDKELNTIVRITHDALNIPPSFPVKQASETLDYDFIKIGDSQFFLPLVATLQMHTQLFSGGLWTKNVKEFRLYRRFSADAVIKFDGQELPPLSDDKTKEQPFQPQPPK
jgi:hypothetical protein